MIIKNCVGCGGEWRYIKAGVSKKTGKPYDAFYACDECGKRQTAEQTQQRVPGINRGVNGSQKFDEIMTLLNEVAYGVQTLIARTENDDKRNNPPNSSGTPQS